ncbi:MAG: hypothetical protein LUP95_05530 [Euryarchaeota archaeon]|nr:hypothetical protein [Euryarchaeota archaeon]
MNEYLIRQFDDALTLSDIFEVVKASVQASAGMSRGGIMLGLANLGNHPNGFLGAFYPVGSNIIVMNEVPLRRIKETDPALWKPYVFHVQLHEYLHSLGLFSERAVRQRAYGITKDIFGEEHLATMLAANTERFIPQLVYPNVSWQPKDLKIKLVEDFDRSSASYFA